METREIIDSSAFIEGRRGNITVFTVIEYPSSLKYSPTILYPETKDYLKAIEVSKDLHKKGTPVPAVDVLIASIASNRNLRLVAKDKHFQKIAQVTKLELELV